MSAATPGHAPPSGEPPRLARHAVGSGPPVVLVHGFTQSARSWSRLASPLAADHEVITVDLPGHGASTSCAVADLSTAADLLGEAGGRATYIGYSLGGRTALTLALEKPELVERLVLVGATAGIEDAAQRAERRSADDALAYRLEHGGEEGFEGFLAEWLAGPLFAHLDASAADLDARRANRPEGLAASLRSCGTGTQRPSWRVLSSLAMPVLVVAGQRDEKFAALATRLVAAIGANAAMALVPGAGHPVPFEAPEAFLALLHDFLSAPAADPSASGV